jgi:hypothetical protein
MEGFLKEVIQAEKEGGSWSIEWGTEAVDCGQHRH